MKDSSIEWTDHTWNPWQGCTKVSPACTHCYMFRDMNRYGKDPNVVRRSSPPTFNLPLKRDRDKNWKIPAGDKVFTCSWSDWFHEAADPWRDEAWAIIRQRPDLIFQIVTKRTDRIAHCLPADWGNGYPNVWLIATAENQEWLERRLGELLAIPAAVRGLSIEPLLDQVNLGAAFNRWWNSFEGTRVATVPRLRDYLQWVIVGGESGPGARPMHPDWAQLLRNQCQLARVPFFFKQWGEFVAPDQVPGGVPISAMRRVSAVLPNGRVIDQKELIPDGHGVAVLAHVGKSTAGRMLDGREWSEFPVVDPVE